MVKRKGVADLSVAHVNKACRSVHISDSNLQGRETGVASPLPSKPCINFSWNWNCTVKKLRFSLNKLTKASLYRYQTAKERSKTNLKQKENHTCTPSENYENQRKGKLLKVGRFFKGRLGSEGHGHTARFSTQTKWGDSRASELRGSKKNCKLEC